VPRILIVDPDPAVSEALALHYPKLYTLIRAETQQQGLALLRSSHPDLALIEHRLPDGVGLDLLRQIKTTLPQLPVVIFTACGSEVVCATALKLGVRDYFIKPCDVHNIVASIDRILLARVGVGERRQNALMPDLLRLEPVAAETARLKPRALRLQRAVELVRNKYWDALSLNAVAREVGLSYFTLSRRFSQTMGVTFRRYLLQFRITKAQDLLSRSNCSVTDISQMVGFSDLPRFDKVFKEFVGTSPSAYRSQATRQVQTIREPEPAGPQLTLLRTRAKAGRAPAAADPRPRRKPRSRPGPAPSTDA
jgi:two-component system response regulator YesN